MFFKSGNALHMLTAVIWRALRKITKLFHSFRENDENNKIDGKPILLLSAFVDISEDGRPYNRLCKML